MTISSCPKHGHVKHTQLGVRSHCMICLAREVEKRPEEFVLTPEFRAELDEFRRPRLPFLTLCPVVETPEAPPEASPQPA